MRKSGAWSGDWLTIALLIVLLMFRFFRGACGALGSPPVPDNLSAPFPGSDGCKVSELIQHGQRRRRPLPLLQRLTFFLEKVSKTAPSSIRPYASLRVPSFHPRSVGPRRTGVPARRHFPGHPWPYTPLHAGSIRPPEGRKIKSKATARARKPAPVDTTAEKIWIQLPHPPRLSTIRAITVDPAHSPSTPEPSIHGRD